MKLNVETHYGEKLIVNSKMDNIRKKECLCLNCLLMGDCDSAKKLYKVCCDDNIALMVTRCKNFKKKYSIKESNSKLKSIKRMINRIIFRKYEFSISLKGVIDTDEVKKIIVHNNGEHYVNEFPTFFGFNKEVQAIFYDKDDCDNAHNLVESYVLMCRLNG